MSKIGRKHVTPRDAQAFAPSELAAELHGLDWSPERVDVLKVPSVSEWRAPLSSWLDRFERTDVELPV